MGRLNFIDVAKGIGILLIIALHSNFHLDWMVSFEMPLFFMLSGVFFSVKLPFAAFSIKKINTILIPYLFFEAPKAIYDVSYAVTHHVSIIDASLSSSIPTTTWFLLCLFEIQLISYFIIKYIRPVYLLAIAALVLSVTGYLLSWADVPNILFLNSAVTGSGYFLFGYLTRNQLKNLNAKKTVTYLLMSVVAVGLCYTVWLIREPYIFYRANMLGDNYLIMVATALLGSIGIVYLSKAIRHNRMLEFYGQNSLIILGVHLYLIVAMERLMSQPSGIVFVIATVAMIPLIWLLRRFCPRLCGVRPLIVVPQKDAVTETA